METGLPISMSSLSSSTYITVRKGEGPGGYQSLRTMLCFARKSCCAFLAAMMGWCGCFWSMGACVAGWVFWIGWVFGEALSIGVVWGLGGGGCYVSVIKRRRSAWER